MNKGVKKILRVVGFMVLAMSVVGCGSNGLTTNKKTKSDYETVKDIDISHKMYYAGFLNKDFGITVGYSGEIHYSTDGGDSWPIGENKSMCRFGLGIVNEDVAYCVGNGGHVRRTADGGKTWQPVTDFGQNVPNQCRYVSFIGEDEGWIASNMDIGSTTDGGKTWTTVSKPKECSEIVGIYLQNKDIAYVLDDKDKMYITEDGAKTWKVQDFEADGYEAIIWKAPAISINFTDIQNGNVYYFDKNKKLCCATTKDGGNKWTQKEMPDIEGEEIFVSRDENTISIISGGNKKIQVLDKITK